MSDLIQRLRGKYSVGNDGTYEAKDFPSICEEAAERIEQLEDIIRLIHATEESYDDEQTVLGYIYEHCREAFKGK